MNQQREPRTVTREVLYQQVWTIPLKQLAKEYGLSDVGLRKACHRHQIPTPPNGYWTKKQWGKEVERPELPTIADPALATTRFEPLPAAESRPLRETFFDPVLGELAEAERQPQMQIVVPDTLRSTHWLITRTKSFLSETRRQPSKP
jgi:hypothetical protein